MSVSPVSRPQRSAPDDPFAAPVDVPRWPAARVRATAGRSTLRHADAKRATRDMRPHDAPGLVPARDRRDGPAAVVADRDCGLQDLPTIALRSGEPRQRSGRQALDTTWSNSNLRR
ncbi:MULTISPECIES: hypothetical protein [Luteimonas]|uniref:hypothetical protein n=1 Tax=Luteimonas TaxID=83614 RepID=UPI001E443347|nr:MULTISPECIES: hypothetical protein [Luteimonas]